jgi:very-short-patch-repair endonuclease
MNEFRVWRTDANLWEKMKPLARQNRRTSTAAEQLLWQCLRNRQVAGHKFRRQFSIERFIVDFYCANAKLVIEVDGPIHLYQKEEDSIRQAFIEGQGLRMLRFTNDDVFNDLESVKKQILSNLGSPSPPAERDSVGEVEGRR